MSAVERATAPRFLLRWVGVSFLLLAALMVGYVTFYLREGGRPWYQMLLVLTFLAIGIGLFRQRRWAYGGAVVGAAHNMIGVIVLGVWSANYYELPQLLWGYVAGEVLLAAIPLLLLRESGRRWFRESSWS